MIKLHNNNHYSNIMNQTLKCPNCNSEIIFNAQALIAGASFECSTCKSKIKLSSSSTNETKKAYDKFTELKKKLDKK
ncbi:MAG: hypothetical protein K0R77_721 [Chryseobacterium sp.]|nr:hypothetical protein [Chryseobacterium sp.]